MFGVHQVPSLQGGHFAVIIAIAAMAGLCAYTVVHTQRNLDLVMTNEFQNMLFSQAVSMGSDFCIFVRRNGSIVQTDRGVREVFGNVRMADSLSFDSVLERSGVTKADREQVLGSIYNNIKDRLVFPLRHASGVEKNFVVTVEPLPRPSGYIIVRGREYRDARQGTQLLPDSLRATSPDKLDHMLSSAPVAHYATDAFGRIEYVNPAFEALSGYTLHHILEKRLQLSSLIADHTHSPLSPEGLPVEFSGETSLSPQNGPALSCLLFQRLIRNDKGKTTGSTGSIITSSMLAQ
jgi:PAS domain S-box-containing protein